MRHLLWILLFVPLAAEAESHVAVYFSPGTFCTYAIVRELAEAKSTIHRLGVAAPVTNNR